MSKREHPILQPGDWLKHFGQWVRVKAHFGNDGVKHLYEVEDEKGESWIATETELTNPNMS